MVGCIHFQLTPNQSNIRKTNIAGNRNKPTAKGKPELTEEQKQEIREAFDLFDTDGSGTFKFLEAYSN